jgi:exoribonuclease-2
MVAANGVIARTFEEAGVASIRRIVRTPKRWDRIVEVAEGLGTTLPASPTRRPSTISCWPRSRRTPTTSPTSRWPWSS